MCKKIILSIFVLYCYQSLLAAGLINIESLGKVNDFKEYSCVNRNKTKKKNGGLVMTFNLNIIELAKKNNFFRKEIVTGQYSQVVLMSVPVGKDIGQEVHEVDQVLVFVQGQGQAIVNDDVFDVSENDLVFVPAGSSHNFKNIGSRDLKLFTIYSPPEHSPGAIEK